MELLSTKSLDGNLEVLVLALLEQEASYGYALNEELRSQSAGAICLKEGTLYPLLHRMEKHAWIQSYWQTGDSKRKRKYYRLSDSGRVLLDERRAEWDRLKRVYQDIVEAPSSPAARAPRRALTPRTAAAPEPSQAVVDTKLPDWLL